MEQKRLGISPNVPVAVQQWEGLIAINYPARAAGITRHMRVHEAKALCPELQCVHVETIGEGLCSPAFCTLETHNMAKFVLGACILSHLDYVLNVNVLHLLLKNYNVSRRR